VGNGSQRRRTAEGTVLEIRLTLRMVVMAMVGKSTAVRRAELQQERAAARGHESHGNICAKQKRGQPYDGRYIGSPSVPEPGLHDLGASPCQSRRHCSSWHRSLAVRQLEAAHPAWSPTAAESPTTAKRLFRARRTQASNSSAADLAQSPGLQQACGAPKNGRRKTSGLELIDNPMPSPSVLVVKKGSNK
jgi:hypothetical protein